MKKIIICLTLFLLLIVGVYYALYKYWKTPIHRLNTDKISIEIAYNTSEKQVLKILQEKIPLNTILFKLTIKLFSPSKHIKAGFYEINPNWSLEKIYNHLCSGKEILRSLTIPEGLTWWQLASILEKNNLTTFNEFKQAVFDPHIKNHFNLVGPSLEGYLFPSTYFLSKTKKYTAKEIAYILITTFKQKTKSLLNSLSPAKVQKIITLASLVEKETALSTEKPIIAGVFLNRLKKNMLLQCDPTVIYGIGPDFNGNLTKKDLKNRKNPYNTYVHKGLPPGPICSPGLESIKAVIKPQKHAYLFFVAKGDGSHFFSETLKKHTSAVLKFQLKGRRR